MSKKFFAGSTKNDYQKFKESIKKATSDLKEGEEVFYHIERSGNNNGFKGYSVEKRVKRKVENEGEKNGKSGVNQGSKINILNKNKRNSLEKPKENVLSLAKKIKNYKAKQNAPNKNNVKCKEMPSLKEKNKVSNKNSDNNKIAAATSKFTQNTNKNTNNNSSVNSTVNQNKRGSVDSKNKEIHNKNNRNDRSDYQNSNSKTKQNLADAMSTVLNPLQMKEKHTHKNPSEVRRKSVKEIMENKRKSLTKIQAIYGESNKKSGGGREGKNISEKAAVFEKKNESRSSDRNKGNIIGKGTDENSSEKVDKNMQRDFKGKEKNCGNEGKDNVKEINEAIKKRADKSCENKGNNTALTVIKDKETIITKLTKNVSTTEEKGGIRKEVIVTKETTKVINESGGYSQFELDCLEQHNLYRRRHHVGDLVLNKSLCQMAAAYAQILLAQKELVHSESTYNDDLLGENLFYEFKSSRKFFGKSAVRAWYAEKSEYDFSGESDAGTAGHFTQLLWKESKELGVGYAAEGGHCYVVCNYYPMGNFIGTFAENVLRE